MKKCKQSVECVLGRRIVSFVCHKAMGFFLASFGIGIYKFILHTKRMELLVHFVHIITIFTAEHDRGRIAACHVRNTVIAIQLVLVQKDRAFHIIADQKFTAQGKALVIKRSIIRHDRTYLCGR